MQFAVKSIRFGKDDTISPGPAAYRLPDSCQVRNSKIKMASYQSSTERDLKHIIGKDNPGVGAYSIANNQSLEGGLAKGGLRKGGGAPSNFVVGYSHLNPTIRRVETVVAPRLADPDHRSKLIILFYCYKSSNLTTISCL